MSSTSDTKRLFKDHQQMVTDNMTTMLQPVPYMVGIPSNDVLILRAKLLLEETLETIEALGVAVYVHNETRDCATEVCKGADFSFHKEKPTLIVEVMDGLADLEYVNLGTAVAFGVDLDPFFKEVHRSNMSKCWTDAEVATLHDPELIIHMSPQFEPGGRKWVVLTKDGKYMKSPSYSPADIQGMLKKQTALP